MKSLVSKIKRLKNLMFLSNKLNDNAQCVLCYIHYVYHQGYLKAGYPFQRLNYSASDNQKLLTESEVRDEHDNYIKFVEDLYGPGKVTQSGDIVINNLIRPSEGQTNYTHYDFINTRIELYSLLDKFEQNRWNQRNALCARFLLFVGIFIACVSLVQSGKSDSMTEQIPTRLPCLGSPSHPVLRDGEGKIRDNRCLECAGFPAGNSVYF